MKPRLTSLLLHPLFIASIALLLINDFYWKAAYPGLITGKLSDVAGLFAFTLFLFCFFPLHKKQVILAICLFFCWWKSSLSQPLILFFNETLQLPVGRVIDYTDCFALLILPLAYIVKPITYTASLLRQVAVYLVGGVAFFSFTATSMIRRLADDNEVTVERNITSKLTETEIIEVLRKDGLVVQPAPPIYQKEWRNIYYLKPKDSTSTTLMIPLDSVSNGLYTRIDYGKSYRIPRMEIAGDTIYNLRMIISNGAKRKRDIRLYSFEYPSKTKEELPFASRGLSQKIGKALKKKFKRLLR